MDHSLLEALPVAAYVTDAEGRLGFCNRAAVELWGFRPELGKPRWYEPWRLLWIDGRPLCHDERASAATLTGRRPALGDEFLTERPDGTRVALRISGAPLKDEAGRVTGGIHLLIDLPDRKEADLASARLAAIVSCSQDAIVGKTLDGVVTSWNEGATRIFGYRPEEMIGQSIRRIIPPELQTEEDEILRRLRRGERIEHFETVRIAKDGRRIDLSITVSPVRDSRGALVGASKVGRDITERKRAEAASSRLAAIISSSDDAIVSKDLDGVVMSWNDGARRIFGYEAAEIVGRSIRQIIPAELQQEEDEILARIRRGERIEHFDTVRIAKDGQRIDVSLTISPILDGAGRVIGASKIARDVRERKRGEELQRLLFNELNHRVKNTLATIQAIASQSMRRATGPAEFVASFNGRVDALARAHDLLVRQRMEGASIAELVRDQVVIGPEDDGRVTCSGPGVVLDSRMAVQLALVLHELATNARKYGALSVAEGALSVTWRVDLSPGRVLRLEWRERGVPNLQAPQRRGFGTRLIERSLEANSGEVALDFGADGLVCRVELPLPGEPRYASRDPASGAASEIRSRKDAGLLHRGKRILLVEDEPLIAMELEATLASSGFEVVGPASSVEGAVRLIGQERIDAALLDANLCGEPVAEVAVALSSKGIPFAFGTGYGPEGLPEEFRDAEILAKPFDPVRLIEAVDKLLVRGDCRPAPSPAAEGEKIGR